MSQQPKLSVLIASMYSRDAKLKALVANLLSQSRGLPVEILSLTDLGILQGGMKIGAKRRALLEASTGTHIVFHDDDDRPYHDYVRSIIPHCLPDVDCIGFRIDCYGYARDPKQLETAVVSARYHTWAENVDGFRYVRHTHHLVPVRRELAMAANFDPKSEYGEDHAYSMRLLKMFPNKREVFIDHVLYTIDHNPQKTFGQ